MAKRKRANDAAFPRPYSKYEDHVNVEFHHAQEGMTMREYIATAVYHQFLPDVNRLTADSEWLRNAAESSVQAADALLAALKKQPTEPKE